MNEKVDFDNIVRMEYEQRCELLDNYSVEQIESLLRMAPYYSHASTEEREAVSDFMLIRRIKLNKDFNWTEENIKQIVNISDEFFKTWEKGFLRVKKMLETLEIIEDYYHVEIILHPEILGNEEDNMDVYNKITDYLRSEYEMEISFNYDPNDKQKSFDKIEEKFNDNPNIKKDLSWNIEGFGDIELKDYYICYALHVLSIHNNWANDDIIKINNIEIEIRIIGGSI